jgi:hypothetical protein
MLRVRHPSRGFMKRPWLPKASFTALLVLLAAAMVLVPLLGVGSAGRFAIELVAVIAMASAVWKLAERRRVLFLAVAAAAVGVAASVAQVWLPAPGWTVVHRGAGLVFVSLVAFCITGNVWRETEVSVDTIVGGIAVYLLLALAWAIAYQLLEFLAPGSFEVVGGSGGNWGAWERAPGEYPRLLFFSFVTLTTLGYGDIVPASAPAAALTSFEAVVGPLYLTILIARLVGLHIAGASGGNPPREESRDP